jgi:RNA polymerase sigma factor (sigma-70 family)
MYSGTAVSDLTESVGIRQLTRTQVQMLRGFIQRRVMNPEDVDDILQSTFLEALKCEHKFQNTCKPETWLCGIALNLIRSHFRKLYKQPYQEAWEDQAHSEEGTSDIGSQVDGYRQLDRVIHAIGTLPSTMQEIILVTLEVDGSYQETATTLGVPIGTVRSRLSRAREQLKRNVPSYF